MRKFILAIISLIGPISYATGAFAINYASVDGNCNIVQQSVTVSNGSTQINVVDCIPKPLDKRFRVRYVWLNSLGISYLVANYFDKSLIQLLGNSPIVYQSTVFSTVKEIIDKFGYREPLDDENTNRVDYLGIATKNNDGSGDDTKIATSIPPSIAKSMKFYKGGETIAWPDMDALGKLVETDGWPDWGMSYQLVDGGTASDALDFTKDPEGAERNALSCVLLEKEITQSDINNYDNNLSLLAKSFESGRFNWEYMPEVKAEPSKNKGKTRIVFSSAGVKAIKYFTQYNSPTGFLYAQGGLTISLCGGNRAGFIAIPKQLFLKVAVVESLSPTLDIQGMRFELDKGPELRVGVTTGTLSENDGGVISLKYGDSVVVPLEIELRDSLPIDEGGGQNNYGSQASAGQEEKEIYSAITSAPMESFSEVFPTSTQKNVTIIKKKSAYRPPHNSPGGNSGSYIFGPSFNLKSVEIEGNWVSVRDPPAAALVANDAGGGASCPFLFADDGQGAEIALGRVLVGAHSLALSSTTVIKLPDKTRTIFLREFEPELTFISRVVLRSEGEERELVRDKAIEPGQQLVVDIPSMTGSNSYLVVSGYYQTIESVLASKPPAVP